MALKIKNREEAIAVLRDILMAAMTVDCFMNACKQ